jgi:hypothetical protein
MKEDKEEEMRRDFRGFEPMKWERLTSAASGKLQ